MEVKFKKGLFEYKYLIMFDLASRVTGICVYDLTQNSPIDTEVIQVTGATGLPSAELLMAIDGFFKKIKERGISLNDVLVSKESAPLQAGKFTTAQTLIALGKAHAILDTYCFMNDIDVYDYTGIAPVTAHAYYRNLLSLDAKTKVSKQDIRTYLQNVFNSLDQITLDESDALFLCITFLGKKWNHDIDDKIREIKRHIKTLKMPHAIQERTEEIERLQKLKI